jgi:hypothetical protein
VFDVTNATRLRMEPLFWRIYNGIKDLGEGVRLGLLADNLKEPKVKVETMLRRMAESCGVFDGGPLGWFTDYGRLIARRSVRASRAPE